MAGFTYAPDETPQKPQGGGFTYSQSEAPVQTYEPEKVTEEPMGDPATGMVVGTQRVVTPPKRLAEDLPTVAELPLSNAPSFGKKAQAQAGLLFSSTPEGAANVIRQTMPDARFSLDKYNNPIVTAKNEEGKEQRYHLDKPGLNALDVSRGVTRGVAAVPLAAGAATIAPAATVGLPLAALMQGTGASVSSLFGDLLSSQMGSEEKPDMQKALVEGGIGAAIPVGAAGVKTLARLFEPDIFNTMSRGAQNFIKQYADKFKSGDVPMPSGGRDIVLDSPQFKAVAQNIIQEAPDSPAAKAILGTVEQREAQTIPRVREDMDKIIGPATVSEREAAESYRQYRNLLSDEESPLLKSAAPIDPTPVVERIRAMSIDADPATASTLRELEKALTTTGGQPAYAKTAQQLENLRSYTDGVINWGNKYFKPGQLSGSDNAIYQIRNEISNLLKKNVEGYEGVMQRFQAAHNMDAANDVGQKILTAGSRDIRPEQVAQFLANPDTATPLRTSVRSLIENKLSRSVDDVKALKSILGGEQDYNRRSLELIFGKNEVNRLMQIVDRELGYRETAESLIPLRAATQGKEAGAAYTESRAPLVTWKNVKEIPEKTIARPLDIIYQKAKGTYGEDYPKSLAEFMTAPAEKVPEYLRGMEKQQTLEKALQRAQQFGAGPLEAAPFASERGERNTGGRVARKAGGRVDEKSEVAKLIRAAEVAKKNIGKQTETILDAPDEHVVKALAVANKTFEG
jgi:hypothetical protein